MSHVYSGLENRAIGAEAKVRELEMALDTANVNLVDMGMDEAKLKAQVERLQAEAAAMRHANVIMRIHVKNEISRLRREGLPDGDPHHTRWNDSKRMLDEALGNTTAGADLLEELRLLRACVDATSMMEAWHAYAALENWRHRQSAQAEKGEG